jgi:hypothetical protein
VFYARRHNVRGHRITMISIFAGALVVAAPVYIGPGADHARGGFRPLGEPKNSRFDEPISGPGNGRRDGFPRGRHRPGKSMKKQREKQLAGRVLGWLKAPRYAI